MRSLELTALMIVLFGVLLSAQVASPVASAAHAGLKSVIHGAVVDVNSIPLPGVSVRLRNLKTNKVEQRTTASQSGEYSFAAQPEIPYVVEIYDLAGHVIAVGDVITVHAGEVAAVLVAIPSRLPVVAGIFGETVGSVVSAASGMGLTVLGSTASSAPPASPEQ
jgi:hypothetical protein